jgi:hypothetical protein
VFEAGEEFGGAAGEFSEGFHMVFILA